MAQETLAWFAGVDWGSEKHQACLLDGHGSIAGEREFPHSGAGLAELGDWLISIAGVARYRCGGDRGTARPGCRFVG